MYIYIYEWSESRDRLIAFASRPNAFISVILSCVSIMKRVVFFLLFGKS